jgi:hypothetical protein
MVLVYKKKNYAVLHGAIWPLFDVVVRMLLVFLLQVKFIYCISSLCGNTAVFLLTTMTYSLKMRLSHIIVGYNGLAR